MTTVGPWKQRTLIAEGLTDRRQGFGPPRLSSLSSLGVIQAVGPWYLLLGLLALCPQEVLVLAFAQFRRGLFWGHGSQKEAGLWRPQALLHVLLLRPLSGVLEESCRWSSPGQVEGLGCALRNRSFSTGFRGLPIGTDVLPMIHGGRRWRVSVPFFYLCFLISTSEPRGSGHKD